MNHTKLIPILLVASLVLIALSGCTGPANKLPVTPPAGGNVAPIVTAPTTDTLATELTSGTGTGSNDVTTEELDAIQNDLDNLDVETGNTQQSNI